MAEILFILTTIYVAYVVYKVADDQKAEMQANRQRGEIKTILTPTDFTPEEVVAPVAEPVVAEEKVQSAEVKSSNELRHPETGEIAKVSNNYRGLKRWLKEALVAEGLLEKVYPANEINDETNAKIKTALEIIKTMPKYH